TVTAELPVDPIPTAKTVVRSEALTNIAVTTAGGTRTPPAGRYGGVVLTAEQVGFAAVIAEVAIARRLIMPRAAALAIACAYQESRLRNLAGGDRDSVGLFQQRPS